MSGTIGGITGGLIGSIYYWTNLQAVGPNDTTIDLRQIVWHRSGAPITIAVPTTPQVQTFPLWIARDAAAARVTPDLVSLDSNGGLIITWPDVPMIGENHFINAGAGGFFGPQIPGLLPCSSQVLT